MTNECFTNGSSVTDFGFTSQCKDSYIKLYDYGARWYDPLTGRFVSPDTIIPDPAESQSFNRYAYVNNNPVKYTDPTGHCPGCESFKRWVTLGWEWLTEEGGSHRVYNADDPLTQDVMNTTAVRITRTQIQQGYLEPNENGVYEYTWRFNTPEKVWNATVDAIFNDNMAEHFLGGFTVRATSNGDGTFDFRVTNSTNRESATRNYFPHESENSWEGLFLGLLPGKQPREELFVFPEDIFSDSILLDRPRNEVMYGGRMNQTFEWTEELQEEPLVWKKYPTELP